MAGDTNTQKHHRLSTGENLQCYVVCLEKDLALDYIFISAHAAVYLVGICGLCIVHGHLWDHNSGQAGIRVRLQTKKKRKNIRQKQRFI